MNDEGISKNIKSYESSYYNINFDDEIKRSMDIIIANYFLEKKQSFILNKKPVENTNKCIILEVWLDKDLDKLIEEYLPKIRGLSYKINSNEVDCLVEAGIIALIDSYFNFDKKHNTSFNTYSFKKI